jgi:hypothetical protein
MWVDMGATGYSRWFERLLAELGFELRVGDPADRRPLPQEFVASTEQLVLQGAHSTPWQPFERSPAYAVKSSRWFLFQQQQQEQRENSSTILLAIFGANPSKRKE